MAEEIPGVFWAATVLVFLAMAAFLIVVAVSLWRDR